MSGEQEGGDAQLTQALDSFDQLTLRRDRQKRRVTEEENAVRGLEDLLKEKQREAEQLAREAESRETELTSLERRVPALEETCRGARRSLQMLTQMRDLLNQQLDTEKRKTEDMLKMLDEQLEAAAARWSEYEAVYLTMPAFQEKVERDALAAEERSLGEERHRLEAELRSRLSDHDFCVRLAECWTQARLLEGAIASAAGESGGDGENMSSSCSQGFGTPRASIAPSPVSDMDTDADPDGGGTQAGEPGGPATAQSVPGAGRSAAAGWSLDGREQRPLETAAEQGAPTQQPAGALRASPGPGRDAEAAPAAATPQNRQSPQIPLQEVPSSQTSIQDRAGPQAPERNGSGLLSPFHTEPTQQQERQSHQALVQTRGRPHTRLLNTDALQGPNQNRPAPQASTQARSAQNAPSPAKTTWSSSESRDPAASHRRPPSFLIQLPNLFRPSRLGAGGDAASSPSQQPASQAQTSTTSRPAAAPAPPPPQPPPPPAPVDVEMADMQDVVSSVTKPAEVPRSQRSSVSPSLGGPSPAEATESSSVRMDARASTDDCSATRSSPGGRQLSAAAEERPRQPHAADERPPSVCAASAEPAAGGQRTPPPAVRTLAGRQYWLPMPPQTPRPPPPDERRNFVQRLRESPELARRPAPTARPAATPPPLETGLTHQFLQPAVPSPRRAAPAATATAAGDAPSAAAGAPLQRSIFDTPARPPLELGTPQRPPHGSPSPAPLRPAPPSTPRPPTAPPEPATPARATAAASAAGNTPRSATAIFSSPEADVGQLDASFSLFGGRMSKQASPQPPAQSSMSLFGAGDVGGDGDQGGDDFSFSFFGGGARGADKETSGGGGGVFSFF